MNYPEDMNEIEGCPITYYRGIPYLHIQYFALTSRRSVQSIRALIHKGNRCRPMHYIRDRSRIFVPLAELAGYPFINSNKLVIYHYAFNKLQEWEQEPYYTAAYYVCKTCTDRLAECLKQGLPWLTPTIKHDCYQAQQAEECEDFEIGKYDD